MGVHRLYLKSWLAAIFVALFVAIILCNQEARLTRNQHSVAHNDVVIAQFDLREAEEEEAEATITALRDDITTKTAIERKLAVTLDGWRSASYYLAILIFIILLWECFLLPRSVRLANVSQASPAPVLPEPEEETVVNNDFFSRTVSAINKFVGEFIAYWTLLAVFVFYYEVIARYIFNSPTTWAHESMYLMFGMQYLLAGGFCLREKAHVRVDVVYMHLSLRARAIADVVTSVFFFIFTGALLATGWIFFHDSFVIKEVSFTEWAIPHWPIKFALPLGGFLILLQGVVRLLSDIAALRRLDTGV
jgi:TRAP-type mannitol/chloroaromatic compound transport system permease small subunit